LTFKFEPFSCEPLENNLVAFEIHVPDEKKTGRIFNQSWVARHSPIRLKITFEDVFGSKISHVLEYVNKGYPLEEKKDTDILFLHADTTFDRNRNSLRVSPTNSERELVKIDGYTVTKPMLRSFVYNAIKTGITEQLVHEHIDTNKGTKVWALIDLSCQIVYAFKVLFYTIPTVSAQMGYVKVNQYEKPQPEKKPIKPANEVEKLPEITTPYENQFPQDDEFDDNPQPLSTGQTSASNAQSGANDGIGILVELNENMKKVANSLDRLQSIDNSLARLADSFEEILQMTLEYWLN